MKLVLYSGYDQDNEAIDEELVRLVGKASPRVTFVPASSQQGDYEFEYFCDTFRPYGFEDISIFNVDQPYSKAQAQSAIAADLIYLSGGNTFYFLQQIKRHHFDRLLKKFVGQGGVLAGLSAGSILMTPSIETAAFPDFDCDDNAVGLRNLEALGLVSFEFFPHFSPAPAYVAELKKQSKTMEWPMYAAADGSGIVVNDDRISFFGDLWEFWRGRMHKMF